MPTSLTEAELLDLLDRGAAVVLPNHRAARTLRRGFDERQRERGFSAWDAPTIQSWADWTRSLWSKVSLAGNDLRLLLNSAQEHMLWREVIESSGARRSLSSPDVLVDMARSAWSVAAAHRSTGRLRSTATTFDSGTFAAWAEAFSKLTAAQHCLPAALLEEALEEHAQLGNLRIEGALVLAGFEELTPSRAALLSALQASDADILSVALRSACEAEGRAATVVPTPREEAVFASRWLEDFFSKRADMPTPRVAVLLPDAQENRDELEAIFREWLAPELQPITADNSSAPWEFASGSPLTSELMIRDALAILQLAQGPLALERISSLLRSPFIGSSGDRLAAARFDARVLRRGSYLIPELDLEELRRVIRRQARYAPAWPNALNDVRLSMQRGGAARGYAEWSEIMRDLLRGANWPGDRAPTAHEFAVARAWDSALDMLATLDFRGRRVAFANAVKTLERILQTTQIAPLPTAASIQIMRPEDAEGSMFDAVVLLHATDEAWPEPARPHPLLGWPLQQELGLPGANFSRDAARARERMESLLARSSNVLFLSAAMDDRGPLRPSPLIRQLGVPFVAASELLPELDLVEVVGEELVPDDITLPPLPANELRGGASVLKLQAACGFLAFSEIRLRAESVDVRELGLDPGERGDLVHRALENFWTTTQSQAELRALPVEERNRRLEDAIDAAFARLGSPLPGWSSAYVRVQRERLRALLAKWLNMELQRGPFTVQRREERTSVPVGPLELKVRPDRIDEVEGGVVLVDYKTGHRVHSSHWDGDRPDDPQLPIYALLTKPGELQALLFGRVRPGKDMCWHGVAANRSVLPRSSHQKLADLDMRREEWRIVLTKLADDFAAGRAEVNPKSFAINCDGCGQRLLCRVDPEALVNIQIEDAELEELADD
ncbi:MAG TPA: PD-(D/E)XK nuclease family protein [Candidatus Aquilonibacter sp.]|nr:PD-(D/E)XK nuclease family protein [Candidatus Aquilonibacter sp.]